ncbi:hypothetical protein [Paenibacillus odorifer]|uniref:Phage tail tape measure protein n=1 Tax=Paenibacillus odorifer TaxID=189426 RepID=A0A1R0YA88_9BACL|nr:hypothetical protein [Paenibacillus odorifer]OMD44296.1 hypothetical protein BSK52_01845 [Paenibacillus odorifer]
MTTGGATNVGEIRARITLEMADFRRQMDEARRRIQDLERDSRRGADGMRDFSKALAGIGAGAVLTKLVSEMRQAVNEANKLFNAFQGLNAVAKGFGIQTADAQKAAQDLAKRGFLTLTESVLAFKTAMSTGLDLEESTKLINSLADSAAYNRQSFYTMGGAIQASLDGIKNGNSVLSDAVGVTKNLSVMQAEYARTIGTTAGKLTDAEKIQAAYNGFIREGAIFTGNADQAMQGFTGSQNRFTQATNEAQVAFGQSFIPSFQLLLDSLTPAIIGMADFVTENKELVAGLTAGTVGVLGFVAILATVPPALKLIVTGLRALALTSGPIGIAVLAIGALAGGIAALTTARAADKQATEDMLKAQKEINTLLDKAPVDQSAADIETLTAKTKELTEALNERASMEKRLNEIQAAGEQGLGNPAMMSEAMDINEALGEMDDKLRNMGFDGVEAATSKLEEMNKALKYSIDSISDQDKAEASALATKKQTLVEMGALASQFKELSGLQTLDASQKGRLVDVTEKLIEQYPELNARQGEDGIIRADNIDMIISQIATDKKYTDTAADHVAQRIRNFSKENEAQAKSVQTQIDNYTRLIKAMAQVSGAKADTFAESVKQGEDKMNGKTPGVMDIVYNDYLTNKVTQEAQVKLDEALAQQQKYSDTVREMEKLAAQVENGAQTFTKDIIAPDAPKAAKEKKEKTGKTPAELAAEMRKAAYEAELKTVQFQADFYDMTADQQIAKYDALKKKHATFLKESVDDARTLTLQLKRLSEDSVQTRYDFSATWIDAEEKRMEDSGKTELQIAQTKLDAWTRLRNRYTKDSEQYKAADNQVRQSRKDVAQETAEEEKKLYDQRTKLIDKEIRRLEDSGATEEAIAKYKVEAWTALRAKYAKDSEYYEKADESLYQSRKTYMQKTSDLAEKLVTAEKKRIETAKKTELDAIETRKAAYVSAQDAKIAAIDALLAAESQLNTDVDYGTQLAEKQARLAELASAVGQEGKDERDALLKEIAKMQLEHDRDLRKRELESQKAALSDEKTAQLSAYDAEKSAAEAQYELLTAAFDAYSGDIKSIEAGIAAFRISEAANANTAILSELDTFIAQYNAKMAAVSATRAATQKDSDLLEYNSNKTLWTSAKAAGDKAEMARLTARNEELRRLYGISSDTGALQAFATGGIVQGAAGAAVPILAHGGEIVLNAVQQSALWETLSSPRISPSAPAAPTYITQNIDMGVDEVTLTDKADIASFYSERTRAASRMQSEGGKDV